jgi:hypothetical protein
MIEFRGLEYPTLPSLASLFLHAAHWGRTMSMEPKVGDGAATAVHARPRFLSSMPPCLPCTVVTSCAAYLYGGYTVKFCSGTATGLHRYCIAATYCCTKD